MTTTDNNEQDPSKPEKKKLSLEDAIKQKLADKKQGQVNDNTTNNLVKSTQKMRSQLTKKPNNQRKRTGV